IIVVHWYVTDPKLGWYRLWGMLLCVDFVTSPTLFMLCFFFFFKQKTAYEIEGRPLASQGMLTVLNQVLRTLLHSRLQLGIQQYQDDPSFQGDIILLEPGETDLAFFKMAPLNLWAGRSAGAHGYL